MTFLIKISLHLDQPRHETRDFGGKLFSYQQRVWMLTALRKMPLLLKVFREKRKILCVMVGSKTLASNLQRKHEFVKN